MIAHSNAPDEPELLTTQVRGNGQRNLIVLSIDQIDAPQPNLEGIWLLITYPGIPNLTLVPIFPNHQENASSSTSYSEVFAMTPAQIPSPQFLDLLTEKVLWDNYLITDRKGTSSMLKILQEAAEINPGVPDPVENFWLPEMPELTLDQQTQLWETVCSYLSQVSGPDNFEILLDQVSPYLLTNLNWDDLPLNHWGNQEEVRLDCDFPTLNLDSP